jgi:hypothetical protein
VVRPLELKKIAEGEDFSMFHMKLFRFLVAEHKSTGSDLLVEFSNFMSNFHNGQRKSRLKDHCL